MREIQINWSILLFIYGDMFMIHASTRETFLDYLLEEPLELFKSCIHVYMTTTCIVMNPSMADNI